VAWTPEKKVDMGYFDTLAEAEAAAEEHAVAILQDE
jgi:hypothetical protein